MDLVDGVDQVDLMDRSTLLCCNSKGAMLEHRPLYYCFDSCGCG